MLVPKMIGFTGSDIAEVDQSEIMYCRHVCENISKLSTTIRESTQNYNLFP